MPVWICALDASLIILLLLFLAFTYNTRWDSFNLWYPNVPEKNQMFQMVLFGWFSVKGATRTQLNLTPDGRKLAVATWKYMWSLVRILLVQGIFASGISFRGQLTSAYSMELLLVLCFNKKRIVRYLYNPSVFYFFELNCIFLLHNLMPRILTLMVTLVVNLWFCGSGSEANACGGSDRQLYSTNWNEMVRLLMNMSINLESSSFICHLMYMYMYMTILYTNNVLI